MTTAADAAAKAATDCDVVVIGGGPAGSTIATLLARQHRRVVLLEKAVHPRFHIGESLLPGNAELFDRLGVREQVERIGMPKWGIEFVSPDHAHRSHLEFADAWDKSQPYAWQVRRSELDELLFRHAAAQGAVTFEGCHARQVDFDADGATVTADVDGGRRSWRAAFVVDASGRDTLLANKLRCKQKNPRHASSALFGHYTGARRLEGRKQGNISIMWFEHGWFWFIPLSDGTTSVGVVCWPAYLKTRRKPLPEFFADTVAMCPELADRLKDATLVGGEIHATGNYSYSADHACGDRYLLLGDAFTFIDPMFSSGVYLAMRNAFDALDVIDARLDQPARAPAARKRYEALARKGPDEFSWFIFRVTNPTIRHLFMYPANPLRVKEALLALLAGDLYGRSPIQPSLWVLKAIYYVISLRHLRRSFRGWRQRNSRLREQAAAELP
ncbi:NAD(P)/FAD-dependent oxidoreductase [Piscinibacter sakaiensis]|uniref:NAD(P)/FAD-dependent oxidoreductase n=1 Tax=Piscinibacter sakaiensis TaxID=1547922 RepID=UPI003AAA992F